MKFVNMGPKVRLQMLAVAHVHLSSQAGDWHAVLRLRPPASTDPDPDPGPSEAEIKRQYRRIAALVHPDKCELPHTAEAFDLLVRAQERLLGSRHGGAKRKRVVVRTQRSGGGNQSDDTTTSSESTPDDEGFEWWGEWDSHASSGRKERAPDDGCCGGGLHSPVSYTEEADEAFLRGLTLEVSRYVWRRSGGRGLSQAA